MSEDRLDKIIDTAADHYNVPPVNPPFEQMWTAIEAEAFTPQIGRGSEREGRRSLVHSPWLRMAAVLVLGVAIGRFTTRAPDASVVEGPAAIQVVDAEASYQLSAERYLGQTVTLFASLPRQLRGGQLDSAFLARASDQLTQLRLLMDSPAANNPRLRALFEDLELVLVQIVQMPTGGSATEAKLIRQAMVERDVMPRLVDAVAETPNF